MPAPRGRARPGCAPTPPGAESVPCPAPCPAPSPAAEVALARPSVAQGPLPGGEGAVAGQMLGVFCEDQRSWGSCSWKGRGRTKQDKAGWSRGERRPLVPPRVGGARGGGAWHGFGKRREMGRNSDSDLMRWQTGRRKEGRMLANAALGRLGGCLGAPRSRTSGST